MVNIKTEIWIWVANSKHQTPPRKNGAGCCKRGGFL
jgi:hypothetical protein